MGKMFPEGSPFGDVHAAQLASDIIFKADDFGNWLNCANKLGLSAELKAIRHIEQ
jgi:hypothetical protein